MDDNEKRAEMVAGLHWLANLIEENVNIPVSPYGAHAVLYLTEAQCRAARKGIYGWKKYNNPHSAYMSYTLGFGISDNPLVSLMIEVSKNETCEKVQTGVKHVEAVEAHDEPVYEWQCGADTEDDQVDA